MYLTYFYNESTFITESKYLYNILDTLIIDTYIHNVSVQSSNTTNIRLMQILDFCFCLLFCYNPLILAAGSTCLMKYQNKNMEFSLLTV